MFLGHSYSKYESKVYFPKAVNILYISLRDSARLDNDEIFVSIILFIRKKIYSSRSQNSISAFRDLIILSTWLYPNVSQKHKNLIVNYLAISYREIINFYSISNINNDEKNNYEIETTFAEINYWSLIQLTKVIIDAKDYKNFNKLFEEVNQISSWFDLRESKSDVQRKAIEEIRFMHRSFYISVYSWLVFSYSNNKISITELENFKLNENIVNELKFKNNIKLFEVFVELKTRAFNGFLEIDNWELKKHKSGKAYMALSSRDWLNFGFTILLLHNRRFVISRFNNEINLNDSFKFLINDIKEILNRIEINLEEIWNQFLYQNHQEKNLKEIFNSSKNDILNTLQELKKKQELSYYADVVDQELSPIKIQEFKESVLKNWNNNNIIPEVLKRYNCVEYLDNIKEIDGLGYFNLYNKMKSMFIEGKDNFVYGASDVGAKLARDIERQFYSILGSKKDFIENKNLKKDIDLKINAIEDKSKYTIFTDWKGVELLNSNREIEYLQESEDKFSYANYKGIPIINNSLIYDNTLLLIDLESSISYTIYQDEKWYAKELMIEVTELTQEVIDDELSKYDEKWKVNEEYEVTKEEAELLIKSSILIKVLFKSQMKVISTDNYYFYKF
ncbi:hypothetical protein [uncultured Winogradskyella sp.]|uniref:hypothetical protein n=1 Tax=uncultured Winogradskyella sp. TaxID=395353 RepID=UPI002637B0CD|nr:hypothetical protein [uncultured Winogradskyella sp.]